ncbi:MAG: VCBS repeat-containing protein [Halobacteriales archaeon]|jgi:VCBS repeat-containing protein
MDHDTSPVALGIVAVVGIVGMMVVAGTAVGAVGEEPTAKIDYEPSSPSVDEAVTFVANASDPDGTIVGYEWRIDGAVVARSQSFEYRFESAGDREVVLTVTDDEGNTTTTSTVVTVRANEPPTVSIDFSPASPTPGETVSFRADAEDPDGEVATYQWRIDGEVVTRERTAPEFQHAFDTAGVHLVSVVVTDADGASTMANASVSVEEETAANFSIVGATTSSPVVEGDRLTATATIENVGDQPGNQTVTLSVGGVERDSTDVVLDAGESTQVTLRWAVEEGDAGTYTASVATANDSVRPDVRVNAPSSADLSVAETNAPVEAGSDLTIAVRVGNPGSEAISEPVSLAVGGEVRDSREVTLGGGENRTVTLTWETSSGDAGEYTANVSGEQGSARQPVTVVEANSPPTVDAIGVVQCDPDCDGEPTFVERSNAEWEDLKMARGAAANGSQFVANTSDDGEIAGYEWRIDGEVVSDSRTLVYTFAEPGEYDVTLRVTDDDGVSTMATVTVTVVGENDPPTVSVEIVPSSPAVGESVTITVEASDPDGSVDGYRLDVDGDGTYEGRSSETKHTFQEAGEHEVVVRVTDDDGGDTTESRTVVVNAPPDPAFDVSGDEPVAGTTATIEADATDPDGTVESYEWRVDGEVVSRSQTLEHSFESVGEHRVALAVTDDDGAERTVTRTISVAAASAGGGNGGPSLSPLLMGLVAVGAIGTAGYLFVRFRQVTGGGGAGESSGDGGDSFEDPAPDDTHTATVDWGDGDEPESTDVGRHTQHDEFDSEDKMQEDSGDGDGRMDPADSAFPPFTDVDSEGANDSDDGDDDPSGTDEESGAEETSTDGDDHGE